MAEQQDQQSPLQTAYYDPMWVEHVGLSLHNVLDYFARSPFYDKSCNNEDCRRKGLPLSHMR